MRIYAAAQLGDLADLGRYGYPHVLTAYNPATPPRVTEWPFAPARLFIDSGAFSAWSIGQQVALDDYAAWAATLLTDPHTTVDAVANLDVIPGQPGSKPTSGERRAAIRQGAENAARLRALGLKVTEVWHRYESLEVLAGICDRRADGEMIAFGGLVGGRDVPAKVRFCDAGFAYLHDRYGRDKLPPVHGFGVGPDSRLGARYHWFSVDCSSWLAPRKFGHHVQADGLSASKRVGAGDWQAAMRRMLDRWTRYEQVTTELYERAGVRHEFLLKP